MKALKFVYLFSIFVMVGGLLPFNFTGAHGAVTTLKAESGEYVVEFEYGTLDAIPAGQALEYMFRLLTKDAGASVSFDSVRAAIIDSKGMPAWSGELVPAGDDPGLARIVLALPRADEYTAAFDFYKDSAAVAHGDFKFLVAKGEGVETAGGGKLRTFLPMITLVCGAVGGVLLGLVLRPGRK